MGRPVLRSAPAEHARAKALRWRLRSPELKLTRGTDPSERLDAIHPYGENYKLERWRSASGGKWPAWFHRGPGRLLDIRTGRHARIRAAAVPRV
jgi:hypothetical protein